MRPDAAGHSRVRRGNCRKLHAEGAQLYECRLDLGNKLVWQVREPIAALILDGKTIGLHYAGPNWQHVDGSSVRAKMVAAAPGATFNDVPWLKLDVTEQRGNGILSRVKTVQRINTRGGAMQDRAKPLARTAACRFRRIMYSCTECNSVQLSAASVQVF
jgi:hypothetical protein